MLVLWLSRMRPQCMIKPISHAGILCLATLLATPLSSAQQAPADSNLPAPSPAAAPAPDAALAMGHPLAIVPLDSKSPGFAAEVTGGLQVYNGRAFIASNGAVTAGPETAQVTLPYRGTLRVCASTTVKLAADSSLGAGEIPGLLMAMDHGAVEASFATGRDSDILMTPDFRILIGGPGAADVKVRLGANGDTCVDNAGVNAPYVLITSLFNGGAYRVQPGQRVMFQHGSLQAVVDQEKEPCGCPPPAKGGNEFPLAQSEGLAPTLHPAPIPAGALGTQAQSSDSLVYNATDHAPQADQPTATTTAATPTTAAATPTTAVATPTTAGAPSPVPAKKKPGAFHRLGRFFKRIFGADD
jgi:hypothetical protein